MKKLIFFFLILSSSIVCSEELKLSCKIKLVTTDDSGDLPQTVQINEVLEVSDYGKDKIILSLSNNLWSVSTISKEPDVVSIKDFSDSTKWDLFQELRSPDGTVTSIAIKIDRNIGAIWYSENLQKKKIFIRKTGEGTCEKVNVLKKKF